MELAVDYQKNSECGDNADFIRYFLIVWLIKLKALWGKGLFDFEGVEYLCRASVACRTVRGKLPR